MIYATNGDLGNKRPENFVATYMFVTDIVGPVAAGVKTRSREIGIMKIP